MEKNVQQPPDDESTATKTRGIHRLQEILNNHLSFNGVSHLWKI
jgi:hypothetical protein